MKLKRFLTWFIPTFLIAVFWTTWSMFRAVPLVTDINVFDDIVINLPLTISRWLDVLGAFLTFLIVSYLYYSFCSNDEEAMESDSLKFLSRILFITFFAGVLVGVLYYLVVEIWFIVLILIHLASIIYLIFLTKKNEEEETSLDIFFGGLWVGFLMSSAIAIVDGWIIGIFSFLASFVCSIIDTLVFSIVKKLRVRQ